MPEKTKHKELSWKIAETEKAAADESENLREGNWSEDQKEKSYYYDDSYGYEVYNPDEDDETENC